MPHVSVSRAAVSVLATAVWLAASPAAADAPPPTALPPLPGPVDDAPPPAAGLRLAAIGASLVPGALVHGSGHFVLGHRQTAYRLSALQGVGVGIILAGALPLALTVGSRHAAGPAAATAIAGVGVASAGFAADLTGVVIPQEWRGAPQLELPLLEAEIGYRYVHHTAFSYGSFARNALTVRLGPVRVEPSSWFALDDDNARLGVMGALRLFGPGGLLRWRPRAGSGSYLEAQVAVTHHHYGSEHFRTVIGEVFVDGRLDMGDYDPHLRGGFAQLGLGWAAQSFFYDDEAITPGASELLLGRFGYGLYLGDAQAAGELLVYYDHRHDDYAGGLTGIALGIPGHIGARARGYLSRHFGLLGEVEYGAALVAGLSLLVRVPGDG